MKEKDLKGLAKAVLREIGFKPNDSRSGEELKNAIDNALTNYSQSYGLISEEKSMVRGYVADLLFNPPYHLTLLSKQIRNS